MDIRILNQEELLPALHMVWNVYEQDVIPKSTPEAIRAFQDYIKYENISPAIQNGRITMFGAFEDTQLCGTAAIESTGRLSLFFVEKEWQGRGIGRMLFQAAYNHCVQHLGVRQILVYALPESVERYRHLGFQVAGGDVIENGMKYTPMETFAIPGLVQPVKKHGKAPIIIGILLGILLLSAVAFAGYSLFSGVRSIIEDTIEEDRDPEEDGWYDEYEYGDSGEEEENGIDQIEAYIADGLSYEIKDENYSFSGEKNSSAMIDFYVNYPTVQGLSDSEVEKKVNDTIKECALKTVDEIYNHPSQEIKERVLNADAPALVSYVNSKTCYANDQFISIVFEDYCYKGSEEFFDVELRTLNINLTDGTVYQVKDIIDLNDDFMDIWLDEMQEEAQNQDFLEEADLSVLRQALEGNSDDDVYVVNFFTCDDGIEIGFNLNYPEGSSDDLGYAWVTAPFDFSELKPYAKDSNFWNLLDK